MGNGGVVINFRPIHFPLHPCGKLFGWALFIQKQGQVLATGLEAKVSKVASGTFPAGQRAYAFTLPTPLFVLYSILLSRM